MNDSLDPRKKYSLNRVNCNNLNEIQKLHIPKCRQEVKQIISKLPHKPHPPIPPRPPPRPDPARPPAPFRPEGVIPFDRKPLDIKNIQTAQALGLGAFGLSLGAEVAGEVAPRFTPYLKGYTPMRPRGAFGFDYQPEADPRMLGEFPEEGPSYTGESTARGLLERSGLRRRARVMPFSEERTGVGDIEMGDMRTTSLDADFFRTAPEIDEAPTYLQGLGNYIGRNAQAFLRGHSYQPIPTEEARLPPTPVEQIPFQGGETELSNLADEGSAVTNPSTNILSPQEIGNISTISPEAPAVMEGATEGATTTAEVSTGAEPELSSGVRAGLRGLLRGAGSAVGEALGSTAFSVASEVLGVAGLGLGIYSEVSGIIKANKLLKNTNQFINGYGGVSMSQQLTGKDLTKFFGDLNDKVTKAQNLLDSAKKAGASPEEIQGLTKNLNDYQSYYKKLINAQGSGQKIIAYQSGGKSNVAIQLNKTQLATAIKNYQTDPDIFKGIPRDQLEFMGLNPNMTLGKAGAVKTPDGSYVPKESTTSEVNAKLGIGEMTGAKLKMNPTNSTKTWSSGAGGGNWSYFYLSQSLNNTTGSPFSSLQDIQNSYTPAQTLQGEANQDYATKTQSEVDEIQDPKVKAYFQYKLDEFKFNNRLSTVKPSQIPPTPSQEEIDSVTQSGVIHQHGRRVNDANTALGNLAGSKPSVPAVTQSQDENIQNQVLLHNNQVTQMATQQMTGYKNYNVALARATNTPIYSAVGFQVTPNQVKHISNFISANDVQMPNLKVIPPKPTAPAPAPASN